MADQELAIPALEKTTEFIIRQTWLRRYGNKIVSIKPLDTVWKCQPAKIIFIKSNIIQCTLQKAFVYIIAEGIITAKGLG